MIAAAAAAGNAAWTVSYALHPEYTYVTAAEQLTRYIDLHPNGNRLLVSISGDDISMMTHLPTLCDDFGTPTSDMPDLVTKLAHYKPGWWATWNDIDPGTLEDLHMRFSLEQVATFPRSITPIGTCWFSSSCIRYPEVRYATTGKRICRSRCRGTRS